MQSSITRRHMKRLLAFVGVVFAFVCSSGVVSAQEAGRVKKVGWLGIGSPGARLPPIEEWAGAGAQFRDSLRDAGYVGGKNVVIDRRHANGDFGQLATVADAL